MLRVVHVIFAVLLVYISTLCLDIEILSSTTGNMAAADVDIEEMKTALKARNQSAFILGYTGETGKVLTRQLLESGLFTRLTLIGRRVVEYTDDLHKNVEQKVIDYDKLEDHKESFQGYDQGFCCMGTTRGKSGADGFYKVDHDYVVGSAKVAKEGGCKHFHLVSSQGANPNSWFLYPKTKGQVEEELKEMDFERYSIYRPGVIMANRQESRPAESIFRAIIKPLDYACPGAISNQVEDIAKAMIYQACKDSKEKVELIDGKTITHLARAGSSKTGKGSKTAPAKSENE